MARLLMISIVFLWVSISSSAQEEVDVELVLAVDVSRSMTPQELEIQRRGYAEALVSDDVVRAIENGLVGAIALRYVEWSGHLQQRVIVDWTKITNRAEAEAFAAKLTARFDAALRRTSISSAITSARRSFARNDYTSRRQVIDISGDGPNNSGLPVVPARDRALEQGIVINGLPLMTRQGRYSRFDIPDLDEYYRNCVIGGPASFVIPVKSWKQFPTAVRQKLVQELAGQPTQPSVTKANFHDTKPQTSYDCLVGEKLWERYFTP